jgi:hypothetical protein
MRNYKMTLRVMVWRLLWGWLPYPCRAEIVAGYAPYQPARYSRRGDPGDPPEPSEVNVLSVRSARGKDIESCTLMLRNVYKKQVFFGELDDEYDAVAKLADELYYSDLCDSRSARMSTQG